MLSWNIVYFIERSIKRLNTGEFETIILSGFLPHNRLLEGIYKVFYKLKSNF